MVEQAPREYLTKVLELSREMVKLARIDPGHEMELGCRIVFGALCDYGYVLKKMAEKELAAIPVLLLTAVGESVDRFIEQCRQAPAPATFVAKPLDVDLLWEVVREVLGAPSR